MAGKINFPAGTTTKGNHKSEPLVIAANKLNAVNDWNPTMIEIKSKVDANFERLAVDWDTEINANDQIALLQRVRFADVDYICNNSYNVGAGKTFTIGNFDLVAPDVKGGPAFKTWFVNLAFIGTSDGSRERPFTGLQSTIDLTAEFDTIIFQGEFNEAITITQTLFLIGDSDGAFTRRASIELALAIQADCTLTNLSAQGGLTTTAGCSSLVLEGVDSTTFVLNAATSLTANNWNSATATIGAGIIKNVRFSGAVNLNGSTLEGQSIRFRSTIDLNSNTLELSDSHITGNILDTGAAGALTLNNTAFEGTQAVTNVTINNQEVSPDFGSPVIKTLSTGVATSGTDRNLVIAAQSGTADDMIELTGLTVGEKVLLRADTGDTITVKHNDAGATVKVLIQDDADFILDEIHPLELILVDTNQLAQVFDEAGGGAGLDFNTLYVDAFSFIGPDGSAETPFQDTPAAIAAANPGAVIYCAVGTYTGGDVVGKNLTFIGVSRQLTDLGTISDSGDASHTVIKNAGVSVNGGGLWEVFNCQIGTIAGGVDFYGQQLIFDNSFTVNGTLWLFNCTQNESTVNVSTDSVARLTECTFNNFTNTGLANDVIFSNSGIQGTFTSASDVTLINTAIGTEAITGAITRIDQIGDVIDGNKRFSGQVRSTPTGNDTFSAVMSFDMNSGNYRKTIITSNVTSLNITNKQNGSSYQIVLQQGGAGSFTVPIAAASLGTRTDNSVDDSSGGWEPTTVGSKMIYNIGVDPDGSTYYSIEILTA